MKLSHLISTFNICSIYWNTLTSELQVLQMPDLKHYGHQVPDACSSVLNMKIQQFTYSAGVFQNVYNCVL